MVCVLGGGFSRVEQTLLENGRGSRRDSAEHGAFQELMSRPLRQRDRERDRQRVIGFMSGDQQDPDMMCEVFTPPHPIGASLRG